MRHYRVLLLGDFIRLSCQERVRQILAAEDGIRIETIWPDVSTEDSRNLAEGIDGWLDAFDPDAVHFNAGLEDVSWHRTEGHNRVPMAEYVVNLQRVVDACKPRVGGDIIFATTTPVIDEKQCDRPGSQYDRFNREIEEYNIAAQQLMLMENVLINHLDRLIAERDDEYLADDGIALTSAGVEAAAIATASCIRALWH